jgi:Carbohydrate-binding module 48 (Isoamylase N-terminal domain)
MDEILISQFIDDELDLSEKIVFVETVNGNNAFAIETLTLLRQEQRLEALPKTMPTPRLVVPRERRHWATMPKLLFWPRLLAGAAAVVMAVGLTVLFTPRATTPPSPVAHRFVVFLPQAEKARIVGTFTDWQPVAMEPAGNSGYWTITLPLPPGDHRYSYLLDQGQRLLDPTVAAREEDDFDGENSLLTVGGGNAAPLS